MNLRGRGRTKTRLNGENLPELAFWKRQIYEAIREIQVKLSNFSSRCVRRAFVVPIVIPYDYQIQGLSLPGKEHHNGHNVPQRTQREQLVLTLRNEIGNGSLRTVRAR